MPKPQTRDDGHALSLTIARGKSPPIPSAFDWPATMNAGMQFDEQFLARVCSDTRLPSWVVEFVGAVAVASSRVPSSCVATLMLARALGRARAVGVAREAAQRGEVSINGGDAPGCERTAVIGVAAAKSGIKPCRCKQLA